MLKTNVYVDGFNLYFGCLKNTPYRWLNIAKLCSLLLPNHDIQSIKYFTALVKPRPKDPEQPVRQQTYLRALKTLPRLEIIYGRFQSHKVRMPLVNYLLANSPKTKNHVLTFRSDNPNISHNPNAPKEFQHVYLSRTEMSPADIGESFQPLDKDHIQSAYVIRTDEKGSDVNLATYLLADAFKEKYETAVVISNDSDLMEAIRVISIELKKNVGILNPQKNPSRSLLKHAQFFKEIRSGVLTASQFPPKLKDGKGAFHKPRTW